MSIHTIKRLLIWVGLFLSLLTAQILIYPSAKDTGTISEAKISLVRNAAVPIFLSENQNAAIRQLENLIQDTDIEEIRVFSSDQQLIGRILNSRVPQSNKPKLIENFPVIFQGTLAGTIQMEVVDQTAETAQANMLITASLISLMITLASWLLSIFYQLFSEKLIHTSKKQSARAEIITLENQTGISEGSSILLYIFISCEPDLNKNADANKNIHIGLFQRLEAHLQIYGGRTLSLQSDSMICRMPSGQPSHDFQQALVFAWGASQPLIFKYKGQQFQVQCKTLLHKTRTAAKPGNLFLALNEVDQETKKHVQASGAGTHLTHDMLQAFDGSSDFEYMRSKDNPEIFAITSINPTLEILWNKQSQNLNAS